MNNRDIRQIAITQSAVDLGADPADFEKQENVMVLSRENPEARRYLKLPFSCQLVSYGSNIVASVSPEMWEIVSRYISAYPAVHCFETPHLQVLNDALREKGEKICFMAEYFLPNLEQLKPFSCGFSLRFLTPAEFADLYIPAWSNALCAARKDLDRLALGAYDGERLIGLAGVSADCETMWQIGIDVLPEYRRRGIAAALTSRMALAVLERGKVPFYCAAWSNIPSVRNAIRCGFRPAWVEMTAKPAGIVDEMNGICP